MVRIKRKSNHNRSFKIIFDMMNREAIIISKRAVMTRFTNAELSINDFFCD